MPMSSSDGFATPSSFPPGYEEASTVASLVDGMDGGSSSVVGGGSTGDSFRVLSPSRLPPLDVSELADVRGRKRRESRPTSYYSQYYEYFWGSGGTEEGAASSRSPHSVGRAGVGGGAQNEKLGRAGEKTHRGGGSSLKPPRGGAGGNKQEDPPTSRGYFY